MGNGRPGVCSSADYLAGVGVERELGESNVHDSPVETPETPTKHRTSTATRRGRSARMIHAHFAL
jgi:hypothetical protein